MIPKKHIDAAKANEITFKRAQHQHSRNITKYL